MSKIKAYALSNIGNVRENHEDNFFVPKSFFIDSETQKNIKTSDTFIENEYIGMDGVFAVCDGMGGHKAGEVASRLAVEKISAEYEKLLKADKDALIKFATNLNNFICDYSEKNIDCSNMGSTFSALVFDDKNDVSMLHIGDSRIYLYKDKTLKQISTDHTEGKRLVDAGIIKIENLPKFPNRKALYKYLGRKGELIADFEKYTTTSKDRYIIASDGLSDTLEDEEIKNIIADKKEPKEVCHSLIDACLKKGQKCSDNVTIVCIDIE